MLHIRFTGTVGDKCESVVSKSSLENLSHMAEGYTNPSTLLTPPSNASDLVASSLLSPLSEACRNLNLTKVQRIIKGGANVNFVNVNNHSPLYEVCSHDHKTTLKKNKTTCRILDVLIQNGADLVQPFHQAIREGNEKIMDKLLARGVEVNKPDSDGYSALHVVAQMIDLHKAPNIVQKLVDRGADVHAERTGGSTPLVDVCGMPRHTDPHRIVSVLLEHGASVNVKSSRGKSPLHNACQMGHALTVAILIPHVRDPDILDNEGNTALHLAANQSNPDVLSQMLQKGGNARTPDRHRRSLLHIVCSAEGDNVQQAKLLVSRGFSLAAEDNKGNTPMYYAVTGRNYDVANALSEVENSEGNTPFHLAAMSGDLATVKFMMNRARLHDCLYLYQNKKLYTPFHCACISGKKDVLKQFLMKQSVSFNEELLSGKTAFLLLCINGEANAIKLALDHGADISKQDNSGRTPLHFTCIGNGNTEAVSCLIEAGVNVDQMDYDGRSALYDAVSSGFVEITRKLLAANADIHRKYPSYDSTTVLHKACGNGFGTIVKLLISKGCDINASNAYGDTPLSLAVDNGFHDLVITLLFNGCSFKGAFPETVAKSELRTLLHWAGSREYGDIRNIWVMHTKEQVELHAHTLTANQPLYVYSDEGFEEIIKDMEGCATELLPLMIRFKKSLDVHRNEFPTLKQMARGRLRHEWTKDDVSLLGHYSVLTNILHPDLIRYVLLSDEAMKGLSEFKDDLEDQFAHGELSYADYSRPRIPLATNSMGNPSGKKKRYAKLGKKYVRMLKHKAGSHSSALDGLLQDAVSWNVISYSPEWILNSLGNMCLQLEPESPRHTSSVERASEELLCIHRLVFCEPAQAMDAKLKAISDTMQRLFKTFLSLLNDDKDVDDDDDDDDDDLGWKLDVCGSFHRGNTVGKYDETDYIAVALSENITVERSDTSPNEFSVKIQTEYTHGLSLHLRDYLCKGLRYYLKYDSMPAEPLKGEFCVTHVSAHVRSPGACIQFGWVCENSHSHRHTVNITPVIEMNSLTLEEVLKPPSDDSNSFYNTIWSNIKSLPVHLIPSCHNESVSDTDTVTSYWKLYYENTKSVIFECLDSISPNIRRVFHLLKYVRSFLPRRLRFSDQNLDIDGSWKDGPLLSSYVLYNTLLGEVLAYPNTSDWSDALLVPRLLGTLKVTSTWTYVDFFMDRRENSFSLEGLNYNQEASLKDILYKQMKLIENTLTILNESYESLTERRSSEAVMGEVYDKVTII